MRKQLSRLIVRLVINALGLWVAVNLISGISVDTGLFGYIAAGLFLALVNAIIKPFVVLISLPAILLSLGIFILIVNGLMLVIVDKLYDGLVIANFRSAILAALVVGLVNYVVTLILEPKGGQ